MTPTHRLSEWQLAALAEGLGDRGVVARLRAGQVSKRKLHLRLLRDAVPTELVDSHYQLLVEAERHASGAVAALLAEPHAGAWLASALREVRGVWPARRRSVEVRLGYLGGLAAAAAVRAGLEFKTELATTDGQVMLPGLGLVTTGTTSMVTVSHVAGQIQVGSVHVDEPYHEHRDGWQPLRHISAEAGHLTLSLRIDDLDPYRDCHRLSAAERLTPDQVATWQRLLEAAWTVLVRHHRPYAEAIAEGLTTVVPLHRERANVGMNVTSMDAFGAVSLTEPADGLGLALGLLHEFQHAKLGAIIDLVPLYHRDDEPRFYAPWRDDPRPLGAALQGVYAFLGVTEFWRVQRGVLTGGQAVLAEAEFARWRDRVGRTLDALAATGRFTPTGTRFLSGLRAVRDRWRAEPVSIPALAAATEAADDHWIGWRLRNRRPEPDRVRDLADRWRHDRPCPAVPVPVTTVPQPRRRLAVSARLDLARLRLTDPDRFAGLRATPHTVTELLPEATPGDVFLADGDHTAAQQWYRDRIMTGDDRVDLWIGLTLASHRGTPPGSPSRLRCPELCLALHRALTPPGTETDLVDPLALADWLRPAAQTGEPDQLG